MGIDPSHLTDLLDEHTVLDGLLVTLSDPQWSLPTPAAGWTIADQVRHLARSERAALVALDGHGDELFGGRLAIDAVLDDRPAALLAAWRDARTATSSRFEALDDRARVTWGAGPMSVRSFADARLMETWAHGLDCFAAVGVEPIDTLRLRRIAGLGLRALPYAFHVAGEDPPGDPRAVALDLVGPSNDRWWLGPAGASDVIAGPASEWCRVATKRLRPELTSLRASSMLAAASLRVARAYLAD